MKYNFIIASYDEAKKFGKNQENRQINGRHVETLKAQWVTSAELIPPITVNNVTNNIIDGQHRNEAYIRAIEQGLIPKETKIKVMYVDIPEDKEKEAIVDANTHSKNWSLDDYIASYCDGGNYYYQTLNEWCRMHSLACDSKKPKYRYGAAIIKLKPCKDTLKDGTFSFSKEELERAEEIHSELAIILDIFDERVCGNWFENLCKTWGEMRSLHTFDEWKNIFKRRKVSFMKMPRNNGKDWRGVLAEANRIIDTEKDKAA